jgi:medium-chain acyl-[acyl-carrier-protein] hydrolase
MSEVRTTSWISCVRTQPGACVRLFCIPYAGAGASVYFPWLEQAIPDVEIYAIHLPGRERRIREVPFSQLSPLVTELSEAIRPYLTRSFAFFGHSMGALISFELTRALRRRYGRTPLHLFMSAQPAPQLPNPEPALCHLSDSEFLKELQKLNGTPSEVLTNKELMQLVLPTLRADFALTETYRYQSDLPFDCPISVFGGEDDLNIRAEHLDAWRDQTLSTFQLKLFNGDHFYLLPQREALLNVILERLRTQLFPTKQEVSSYRTAK